MVMFVEDEKSSLRSVEPVQVESIIEWVPIADIKVDLSYQRPLSKEKVQKIAANFDRSIAGLLILSMRNNGDLYCVDGQHRLASMQKIGEVFAKCEIIQGLTIQQEAAKFRLANTSRKSPEALDLFRARLVEGDPVALAIGRVVEKCGLTIQFKRPVGNHWARETPSSIWAVSALEDIYRKGGSELLEYILTLALESWPGDYEALSGRVLLGLLDFHTKYEGLYDRRTFVEKMNTTKLMLIQNKARFYAENMHTSQYKMFGKALQEAYDWHRRGKRLEPRPDSD